MPDFLRVMMKWILPLALISLSGPSLAAADHSAEQKRIVALLNSADSDERIEGCRALYFSGITSEKLFNVIERRLRTQHQKAQSGDDKTALKEMAWYAKALSSSGNKKYLPTFQELVAAGEGDLGSSFRYLQQGEDTLLKFEAWNAEINDEKNHQPGQDWEVTSTLNMLHSEDPELSQQGVMRVRRLGSTHPALFDAVETLLLNNYMGQMGDRKREDTIAWYCRLLGESQNPKYRDTLSKVVQGAASSKIRSFAKRALESA